MHSFSPWKFKLILLVLVVAILGATPNFFISEDKDKKQTIDLPSWWPSMFSQSLNLGLDLKGGIHLVLDVDVDKAVIHSVEQDADSINQALRDANIKRRGSVEAENMVLSFKLKQASDADAALSVMKKGMPNYTTVLVDDKTLQLTLQEKAADEVRRYAIDQSIEVVRRRIDGLGTTEPMIIRQGQHRILVQIPGVGDSTAIKRLLNNPAVLEFKLVDEKGDLEKAMNGQLAAGSIIKYGKDQQPYLLKKRTELSGEQVADARVSIDSQYGGYAITLKFNSKGAHKFDRLTKMHVGDRFAIILNDKVHSAPVIRERIAGGSAQITGDFGAQEARELALVLRAGALPAPLNVVEERSVGPSLGKDSIEQGYNSILIGCALVLLFMMVYYKLFGIVANIALIFNVAIIMAVMSMLGATLTLPGIAGIVLTIGMAVDANVLIFERIREELALGKTPLSAIEGGYNKAFWTIFDANLTTLIAAVVLFMYGSGPVKGFAITLAVGICASMFTAILVTRGIVAFSVSRGGKLKKLSI
ncbi:MAG: protein translocase subunit SecD [Mariprofundaceae bacterium]|nr:protein translocase subunit SecD [Mariprofundaceae bacterium]